MKLMIAYQSIESNEDEVVPNDEADEIVEPEQCINLVNYDDPKIRVGKMFKVQKILNFA